MRVVILVDRLGTRLQEETTVKPKPIIEMEDSEFFSKLNLAGIWVSRGTSLLITAIPPMTLGALRKLTRHTESHKCWNGVWS